MSDSNSRNSRNSSPLDCDRIIAALPKSMQELAGRIGPAGVFELMQKVGGRRVYVSRGRKLSALIRPELLEALISVRGFGHFNMPLRTKLEKVLRNDALRADAAAGLSRDILIDRYGVTYRHLRRIIKAVPVSAR